MMKKRTGMTLIEVSLTVTLVSIMMLGLFELAHVQRNVIKRLQHNTTALYLLESIKNQIRSELDHGASISEINSESLQPLVKSPAWKIDLEPLPDQQKLLVSLHNLSGGLYGVMYQLEVKAQ